MSELCKQPGRGLTRGSTTGRIFLRSRSGDTPDVYAQIGEELASQYTIGYTPKNPKHDGAWRRVIVQHQRVRGA